MVKEEEHGDNQAWDDGHKDPADWKVPELNEEDGPVGTRWPERGAYLQRLLVEGGKLAEVRHADEDNDTDGCGVFSEAHADVAVKKWVPTFCRGEKDGKEHCADGANDGVKKGGEGEAFMSTLQLLYGLVEVDDTVQEGEDLSGESCDVAHRPVVGVDDG